MIVSSDFSVATIKMHLFFPIPGYIVLKLSKEILIQLKLTTVKKKSFYFRS